MSEDLTKRSGIFKTYPVDISNTFVKTTNNDGERLILGSNFEDHHTDVSSNLMLYLEGDAKFTKNVTFDGSLNEIDICGTLTADTLRIGQSITNNTEQGDYENCLIYVDISGQLKATQINFNKLEYATALDFSGNSISVLEDDDFAVNSTREYEKALLVHKEVINGGDEDFIGIKTSDPKVTLDICANDAIQIPVGTTDERPSSTNSVYDTVRSGMMRYNSTTNKFEGYSSSKWSSLGGVENTDSNTKIVATDDSYQLEFYSGNNTQVNALASDSSNATMILDASGQLNLQNGSVINIETTDNLATINLISDSSGITVQYDESANLVDLDDDVVEGTNDLDKTYTLTNYSSDIFTTETGGYGVIDQDISVNGIIKAENISLINKIDKTMIQSGEIDNTLLENSSITLGSTQIELGSTINTITGLTDISAENLNGIPVSSYISSVSTNDIVDYAVTTDKIASDAITNAKLENTSITLGTTEITLGNTVDTIEGMDEIDVNTIKVTTLRDQNGNKIDFDLVQLDDSGNEIGTVLFLIGDKSIMTSDVIEDVSLQNVEVSQTLSLGSTYPDVSQALADIEDSISQINVSVSETTSSQWVQYSNTGIYYNDGNLSVGKDTVDSTYKLDVSGDIHLSGSIYQNGNIFSSGDKTDFVVTVDGSSFLLDGVEKYIPTFKSGQTYTFDQSDSTNSGHPMAFYLDSNKTTSYTTDVSTSGDVLSITITDSTPTKLYYQCENHSNMGNAIVVIPASTDVTNTEFAYLSGVTSNIQEQFSSADTNLVDLSNNVYSKTFLDASHSSLSTTISDLSDNTYSKAKLDTSYNIITTSATDLSDNVYSKTVLDASHEVITTTISDLSDNTYSKQLLDASYSTLTTTVSDLSANIYSKSKLDTSYNTLTTTISDLSDNTYSKSKLDTSYNTITTIATDLSNNAYSKTLLDASHVIITTIISDLSENTYSKQVLDASYSTLSTEIATIDNNLETRSRAALSAINTVNVGGSVSYDSATGNISYTGPTTTNIRDQFTSGTGVTITSGEVSIGQPVATTDSVVFNELTVTGNTIVRGNLTLDGSATYVNTTNVDVSDNILVLNSLATRNDAGVLIRRNAADVSNAFMGFDEPDGKFVLGLTSFDGSGNASQTDIDKTSNFEFADLEIRDLSATGIETTGNVTIGGSLSVTNTFNADTVTNGVYTTSSVTTLSDVTSAGSGQIITDDERTKLTNIENSADVTDAENVLAAGAVMTSGDQTIAGSKTFQSDIIANITGNAATATSLETTRSIGGISFNGTSDISTNESMQFGSLGLGTAPSESYGLIVSGQSSFGSTMSVAENMEFTQTTDTSLLKTGTGDIIIENSAADIRLLTSNYTGKVGVNKTPSLAHLDVSGDTYVSGTMTATTFSGSGANLTNIPNSALTNNKITINNVDVTLGGSLTISGTTQWSDNGSDIYFNTGSVGIGTTSPSATLDVNGDIKMSGNLYSYNQIKLYSSYDQIVKYILLSLDNSQSFSCSNLQIYYEGVNLLYDSNYTLSLVSDIETIANGTSTSSSTSASLSIISYDTTQTKALVELSGNNYINSFEYITSDILGWSQLGDDIDGEASTDFFGYSVSLSSDGTIVAIGAYGNDGNGTDSGHVRIYQYANDTWSQLGDEIDGEASTDFFGYSVSLSSDGTIVAIGANRNDGNGTDSGHVRIYQYANDTWSQLGDDIDGEASSDYSGHSISLSSDGTIVAIGANKNDGNGTDSGHVRIYQYANDTWSQLGDDIDGEASGDFFGYSVSLSSDGTIVAIGAYGNDGNGTLSGHVRIYQYANDTWSQLGDDIDGEASRDYSGYSVSLSSDGTIVAIGAYRNDGNGSNSGHVRIYQYANDTWSQLGDDIDGEASTDFFGYSVSLSSDGTIVAIGAYGNDGNGSLSGHVRIYQYANDTWSQLGDDIDGEASGDYSGHSVSLSSDGTIVAIGAYRNDGNGTDSGHVRVYSIISPNIEATFVDKNLSTIQTTTHTPGTESLISDFYEIDISGNAIIRGKSEINGFFASTGGSKIVVQNEQNGGSGNGIYMWHEDRDDFGIYMAASNSVYADSYGLSLSGGAACSGYDFDYHAIRFRIQDNIEQGFIFENSNEECLMSIRGSDGNTYIKGDTTIGETLVVNGAANISSDLTVSGNITDGSLPLNCGAHYYFYETSISSSASMTWGNNTALELSSAQGYGTNATATTQSTQRLGSITSTDILNLMTDADGTLILEYLGGYPGIYNIKFGIAVTKDTSTDRTILGIKAGVGDVDGNTPTDIIGQFWDYTYSRGDDLGEHVSLQLDFNVEFGTSSNFIKFYTSCDNQSTKEDSWVFDNTETSSSLRIHRIDTSWQYLGGP
jgi:hypothetical protein